MHLGDPLGDILDHCVIHDGIVFGCNQKLQVLEQMGEENREHVLGTIQSKSQNQTRSIRIDRIPRDEITLLSALALGCRGQRNVR